jgi:hypothetical protein
VLDFRQYTRKLKGRGNATSRLGNATAGYLGNATGGAVVQAPGIATGLRTFRKKFSSHHSLQQSTQSAAPPEEAEYLI